MKDEPRRGDFWLVDLDPVRGREQSGRRPALIVSVDLFRAYPKTLPSPGSVRVFG